MLQLLYGCTIQNFYRKKCAFVSSFDILSYDRLKHWYETKKTVKINNKFMKFLYKPL